MKCVTLKAGDAGPQVLGALEWSRDHNAAPVVIDGTAIKYPSWSSTVDLRPKAGEDRCRVNATFVLGPVGFDVRVADGPALRTWDLKNSYIKGLALNLRPEFDGCVGVEQGNGGSSSFVTWEDFRCLVRGKRQRAFVLGKGANDVSNNRFVNCSVTGMHGGTSDLERIRLAREADSIGFHVVGGNTLNNHFETVTCSGLGQGWRLDGGDASTFVNCGGSHTALMWGIDGAFTANFLGGRVEESGCLLMHGSPFNVGSGRGNVSMFGMVAASMCPDANRSLGIADDGEILGLHDAGAHSVGLNVGAWRGVVPASPIVLASAPGLTGSMDLRGMGVDLRTSSRGAWLLSGTRADSSMARPNP